jgi:hypothetical protein
MNKPTQNQHPVNPEAQPDATALIYADGSVNMHYRGDPGSSVNLEAESLMRTGYGAEAPYCLVEETGVKHYISPGHGGAGVMLTPAPSAENPDRMRFALLNNKAPTEVTFGESVTIPGLTSEKQPKGAIVRVDMLTGTRSVNSEITAQHIPRENPFNKVVPKFDEALAKAKTLGHLAQ